MEACSVIFFIPEVMFKSVLSPEEVVILFRIQLGIPCRINVIIQVPDPDDIPGMVAITGSIAASDDSRVKPRCKAHPVEQCRIALADGCPVYKGCIGCVLELIGIVFQVIKVVDDMAGNLVKDCAYFFMFGLILKVERFHDLIELICELIFLGFCCVVADFLGVVITNSCGK